MRRRAFLPDALDRLEDRVAMSGAPRGVALSGLGFNLDLAMVRGNFQVYMQDKNLEQLRSTLAVRTAAIPFHKGDGLGMQVNAILAQMQAGLAAGAPQPIVGALHQVVATFRADVQARIDDGSVVIR